MSWWNPSNWFNNRGGGGIGDHEREMMNDRGMIQETVIGGGGPDTTTTYDNWAKYDAGQPSGSYNWGDGYRSSWSDAFRSADRWNKSRKDGYIPGYMSGGSFNWPTKGVTKVGANSHLVDPTASWWGKHQIYHHPQKQGGGIGGMIGSVAGTLIGNTVAPGIGGKIGGSIGGSIGSSF
tara:strand:- start:936 stop:1469 length:534 start_codon:yes stop_codon:yes gene_type:complete